MPYFKFCREYSTATCNLHCQETLTVITNTKIWQVVHFSVCSKCPPPAFTQARSLFRKLNTYGFFDRVLWQLVPYRLQNFLELIDVLRFGLKWLVAFKHSSPDMVVQRVEVRRVSRPFTFINEFTAVCSNPVLSQLCRACRRAVILKDEAIWQNRSAFLLAG